MSEDKYYDKSLRLQQFNGTKDDWPIWSEKFLIRAHRIGYRDLLLGDAQIPKKAETGSTEEEKKSIQNRKDLNLKGFEELAMGIDTTKTKGRVAFNCLRVTKTTDYPDGNIKDAWDRLSSKYVSKETVDRLELRREIMLSEIDEDQDPDEWITTLEEKLIVLQDAGGKYTEEQLIEQILASLPEDYDQIVRDLEKRLEDTTRPLSLSEIRKKVSNEYKRIQKKNRVRKRRDTALHTRDKERPRKNNETAKYAGGPKNPCPHCGKRGHWRWQCPERRKDFQEGNCFICKKPGHKAFECPNKRSSSERANRTAEDGLSLTVKDEFALRSADNEDLLWIADSGATGHMTANLEGMVNVRDVNENIIIADDSKVRAEKIGDLKLKPTNSTTTLTLKDVWYIPTLGSNLLSVTKATRAGFQLRNEGNVLIFKKDGHEIKFNKEIKTKRGHVMAMEAIRTSKNARQQEDMVLHATEKMDINEFHQRTTHMSEDMTKKIAREHGIQLTGQLAPCEACARAKAKQKNIKKVVFDDGVRKIVKPGAKIGMDISYIKDTSYGGSKFWLLMIDYATDYCWSYFLKSKDETGDKLVSMVKQLKNEYKIKDQIKIRCDNAGENKTAEQMCKSEGLNVVFEYTAPNTPQQNGKVERKFATLYGRVRATLNQAGLEDKTRKKLWAECANHCTILENIMSSERSKVEGPWHNKDKNKKTLTNLRKFGELGVVKNAKKIQAKLTNKGETMMFVGMNMTHEQDCYRFLNPKTQKIIMSRDVIWLNKTKEPKTVVPNDDEDDNDDEPVIISDDEEEESESRQPEGRDDDEPIAITDEEESEQEDEQQTVQTPRPGLRELKNLADEWNEEARIEYQRLSTPSPTRTIMDRGMKATEHLFDEFALFVKDNVMTTVPTRTQDQRKNETNEHILDRLNRLNNSEGQIAEEQRQSEIKDIVLELKANIPETYEEAFHHTDEKMRDRWRAAIDKEKQDFKDRGVMQKIKRNLMPQDRRCIKCKWVFDVKRNGRFRARLVACGYSQIPGIDFTESYAPVIQDITWRILVIIMISKEYEALIADVETAFLHGDLEEEIYMDCPPGFDGQPDECMLLKKAMYGLVQAARQYYLKFIEVLEKQGYRKGKVDPCLIMKGFNNDALYMSVHVDDSLVVGPNYAIYRTIDALKNGGFSLTIEGKLDDYLSCEITLNREDKSACIHQPHLIAKLEKKFKDVITGAYEYNTPGTPHKHMQKTEETKVSEKEHSRYRSGVGMLLYLAKHTRPDISNAVRELSKVLDAPGVTAWKELKRVIKYVINTKEMALRIKPEKQQVNDMWQMVAFSDSDWGNDRESRKSISGYILYLCGVPISWKSKAQKGATLSSTEAEYVALSEAAKEVKFIYQVLIDMGAKVKLPIVIRVDNVGAIFMSENTAISDRTKHVDIRYNFVREFIEDGFVKIIFVRTHDNIADLFTKNLPRELHEKHKAQIIENKELRAI